MCGSKSSFPMAQCLGNVSETNFLLKPSDIFFPPMHVVPVENSIPGEGGFTSVRYISQNVILLKIPIEPASDCTLEHSHLFRMSKHLFVIRVEEVFL